MSRFLVMASGDPAKSTCELRPVCDEPVMACRKPKYSRARKAWVRIESRERGVQRYWAIAQSIARTARRLEACKADECEPIQWKGSTRQLALSTLTVALHESGLREDVQFGRPPFGRGPAREACLVQVATDQAPLYASWVPADERQRIAQSRNEREKFARTLLGDDPAALDRCFEVGMRMLARARNACSKHQEWDFAMFSMYGSGRTCRLPGVADKRKETLRTLQTKR